MIKRPDRDAVANAIQTLVDAQAISSRHAMTIMFDAGFVAGNDAGESRAKAKVDSDSLLRLQTQGGGGGSR